MKVLLVSNMYSYPGNWDKLDELGRLVELHVVTPARWATDKELHPVNNAPRYSGGLWRHHPLPTLGQGNPFRYLYFPAPLMRVMRDFRPDVVHVEQEPESLCLLQLSALKALYRYRLLFVAWENVNPLPQGWLFRQLNFRAADGALFGNRAALERCVRFGFHKPSELLPQYGFQLAPRRPATRRARSFAVGYAGRLVPEKGILTLLAAACHLPSIELMVAGDGPLSREVRGHPQVRWLGTLDRNAMSEFWQRLDALVLPSLTTRQWAEQFGRVLVEAMAHGVPVIGSSSGAIPEVVDEAGLIFPEGDVNALANAIKRLSGDAQLRDSLVQKGYERVRRVYHNDVIMHRTVQFYRKLLDAPRALTPMQESAHAPQH